MKYFFALLFVLIAAHGFSQPSFTLSQLVRLNNLPEKDLVASLKMLGYTVEGQSEQPSVMLTFINAERQHVAKVFGSGSSNSIIVDSTSPLDFEGYRKELTRQGYKLQSSKTINGALQMEVYLKGKAGVALTYSNDSPEGKAFPPIS